MLFHVDGWIADLHDLPMPSPLKVNSCCFTAFFGGKTANLVSSSARGWGVEGQFELQVISTLANSYDFLVWPKSSTASN